ncbi:MAG: hypothetical protein AMXMBFR19_22140 [Chthonomonadaceae bacterium]|uniref:YD repeat protein n=1 Tax=Candidatus Nitrosymbiomonas proteolyticus TaxID=2608984 RepID=A0A809S1T6_9BACT|nr:conserved hypothetical protein [Candidatus Nitrosymbiomonas proteolyticus]
MITRNLDGNPITWTYDDLYRLTGQQKAGQVCTYTLDGVGNLKTMWEGGSFPRTFTFNAADRLVTMVEGADLTTYTWTGYGALESEVTGNQTTGYAYNGQDQLAVVTEPSGDKTTYSFDGDGLRRSAATTNQNEDPPTLDVTTMVWDGSDYLLLHGPTQNRVVLTLEGEIVSCGSKDLLTDPLGSLVKEISAGASLGSLIEMYPYGTLIGTRGKPSTPFVYIAAYGYYYDSIDRDYVRARELYKKLGRWMQTDPLWPEERTFGYAGQKPVIEIDPSGLASQDRVKEYFDKLFPPGEGIPLPPGINPWPRESIPKRWSPSPFWTDSWCGLPAWGYGECCGVARKCGSSSKTYNCTDEACKQHDICVGASVTGGASNWIPCNRRFCNDIKYCWNKHCTKQPFDWRQCQAIHEISLGYCNSFGGPSPGLGAPWR